MLMKSPTRHASGFSLLEALIAVVILSIGLLGIARLQLKTQQFNRSAYFETQAIVIAHDMFERIRANISGRKSGFYHLPKSIKHAGCYSTVGCSTLDMSQNDMHEWSTSDMGSIANKIPGGAGIVCIDATPDDGSPSSPSCDNAGNTYAVKIWWQGDDKSLSRRVITAAFE